MSNITIPTEYETQGNVNTQLPSQTEQHTLCDILVLYSIYSDF